MVGSVGLNTTHRARLCSCDEREREDNTIQSGYSGLEACLVRFHKNCNLIILCTLIVANWNAETRTPICICRTPR